MIKGHRLFWKSGTSTEKSHPSPRFSGSNCWGMVWWAVKSWTPMLPQYWWGSYTHFPGIWMHIYIDTMIFTSPRKVLLLSWFSEFWIITDFFFLIFNTYGLLLNHIKPIWIYELRLPWATPGVTPSGRKIVAKVAMSSGSVALDWVFLGKSTGNHGFYHEKYGWKLVQGQKTHGYSIGLF